MNPLLITAFGIPTNSSSPFVSIVTYSAMSSFDASACSAASCNIREASTTSTIPSSFTSAASSCSGVNVGGSPAASRAISARTSEASTESIIPSKFTSPFSIGAVFLLSCISMIGALYMLLVFSTSVYVVSISVSEGVIAYANGKQSNVIGSSAMLRATPCGIRGSTRTFMYSVGAVESMSFPAPVRVLYISCILLLSLITALIVSS